MSEANRRPSEPQVSTGNLPASSSRNSVPSLRSPKDVQQVREQLLKEQGGIDAITGLEIPPKQAVLDHCHESQHCRSTLSLNSNAFEGLVFNAYKRCLSWYVDKPLPEILRRLALYLEKDYTANPYHPGWMKKVKTEFNKMKAKQQNSFLVKMGECEGNNLSERQASLKKIMKTKGYEDIMREINAQKNTGEVGS